MALSYTITLPLIGPAPDITAGPPIVSFALPKVMANILEFQSGASKRRLTVN